MNRKALSVRGYEIKEEIGAGGFGVVYRAHQHSVGRNVAIKIVLPEISRDPTFILRFDQEAKLAAQLEHPSIVPLYDYWQDEERAYLVMRWLKGGSLHDLLEHGSLNNETAVRMVTQISSALGAAHEQGIIHRDIKPANVLLDEKGNAYLSDFGIAKYLVDANTGSSKGAIIGSPIYMAPEQITGGEITAQSDIYSLGLLVYAMVTGKTPYGEMETVAMLYSKINESMPPASQLNPALPSRIDLVIQRATANETDLRYSDAGTLAAAFSKAMLPDGQISEVGKAEPPPHNLPVQTFPFIGRGNEVEIMNSLLADPQTRLVTIIGPGGMGKTRLALATTEYQIGNYEHGVYFVPLASVQEIEDVALAIGRAIGFNFTGRSEPALELADYLRSRSMLLLLDNFEHLLSGANIISEILGYAPGLNIVVTSRSRLQLQEEQLLHLEGLPYPSWEPSDDAREYAAVQLFVQSAQRIDPDYKLTEADLVPLVQICRLTQGMPLGILLSAGWIELLSPSEIAEELSHNIDFLESTLQDVPERQRSMRAVFEYTWEYLKPMERELLKKLSVFHGGCTVSAAREITGASLLTLRSLVDKSLLQSSHDTRYEIHELMRQYAAEKLGDDLEEENRVHSAHCHYYLTAMAEREEALFSRQFTETMDAIDTDLDNVRAAWRRAVEKHSAQPLLRAIKCLFYYHYWKNNVQLLSKDAQFVIDHFSNSENPEERLVCAWSYLYMGWYLPNDEDKILVEKGLAIIQEPAVDRIDNGSALAFGLSRLGHIVSLSDTDRSRELLAESLAHFESIDERQGKAGVLLRMSHIANSDADFHEEERLARTSYAIRQDLGNPLERAESLRIIAYALLMQGRIEEGLEIGRKLEAIARNLTRQYSAGVVGMLPAIYRQAGRYEEAFRRYAEVVVASEKFGDPTGVKSSSFWRVWVGLHLGQYTQYLSVAADQEDSYSSRYYVGHLELGRTIALLGLLDPEDSLEKSQKAVENFRLAGLLPRLSQSLAVQAIVLRTLGKVDAAGEKLHEGIRLSIEMQSPPVLVYSLAAATLLIADRGSLEMAAGIYTLAAENPLVANSRWFYDVVGKEIEALAGSLLPAAAESALKPGEEMDLWLTARELLAFF